MFSLSSRSHPRAEAGEPPRHRGDQKYKHRQLMTEGGERKVETHVEWVGALSGIPGGENEWGAARGLGTECLGQARSGGGIRTLTFIDI